jgi:acyl-CoA hydrolase
MPTVRTTVDVEDAIPTASTRLTISQVMGPGDVNLMGTVHGGVILRLVDTVAGVVSARFSHGSAVTAFVDEVAFVAAVHVGDVVHVDAQVNWAGSSSMEVGVRVTADRWNEKVPPVHVVSAYLVMVAVDDDGRSRTVPRLEPVTAEDHRRHAAAAARRAHRLRRRR